MALKIAAGFMAALFVFGAVLQYNDPDPLSWIAIYLVAAYASVRHVLGGLRWPLPAALAFGCFVWALRYVVAGALEGPLLSMFDEWRMRDEGVVASREFFGLVLIGGWMVVLLLAALRNRGSAKEGARTP